MIVTLIIIIVFRKADDAMIKHSKQRDCIQEFLMTRQDHPTAETVYMNIRRDFPRISLATVYRNLSLLADIGEIQKISTPDGPDRFDARIEPHVHFSCDRCGNVIDLEMENISYLDEIAGKSFSGRVQGHSILFHGICPECMESGT